MSTTLWEGRFDTQYGQMYLQWGSEFDFVEDVTDYFVDQVNGLVGVATAGQGLVTMAGWQGGMVRVVLCASEPDIADEWEDVVEVSLVIHEGEQFCILPWGWEEVIALPELVPAAYRLRVSFRDRDVGHQDNVSGMQLLEFWQALTAPDDIRRTTSDSAAYWHKAWGTRSEGL